MKNKFKFKFVFIIENDNIDNLYENYIKILSSLIHYVNTLKISRNNYLFPYLLKINHSGIYRENNIFKMKIYIFTCKKKLLNKYISLIGKAL